MTETRAESGTAARLAPSINAWPELMRRETAAAYVDMTTQQFDRQCPVAPVDLGARGYRWKEAKLDAWIAGLADQWERDPPEGLLVDDADTAEARRAASIARTRRLMRKQRSQKDD